MKFCTLYLHALFTKAIPSHSPLIARLRSRVPQYCPVTGWSHTESSGIKPYADRPASRLDSEPRTTTFAQPHSSP